MDIKSIEDELKEIEGKKNSQEAQYLEHLLFENFIRYVADVGPTDLSLLAKEVLKTLTIDIERYYT